MVLAGRAFKFLRDLPLHILDGPLVDLEPAMRGLLSSVTLMSLMSTTDTRLPKGRRG
ncbi:hypothetical protein [Streptomyces sp. NPDC059863]|uniref:hypothetical protein n=1 Tax=unclassified Streptomyces TaxID=2593676 RepID=UPI00364FAA53